MKTEQAINSGRNTIQSNLSMAGSLSAVKITPPGPGLKWKLENNTTAAWFLGRISNILGRGLSKLTGLVVMTSELSARHFKADGSVIDYGIVSRRVITTAFVDFMVDQLQAETSVWGDFKFHDSGVGSTAAAIGNTDIETTDAESRVTGTQAEGASSNIYQSVGTISYTTTKAITEHGLFSIVTAGTLMDRHVFAAINVVNGDSIQFTYELTVSSGG